MMRVKTHYEGPKKHMRRGDGGQRRNRERKGNHGKPCSNKAMHPLHVSSKTARPITLKDSDDIGAILVGLPARTTRLAPVPVSVTERGADCGGGSLEPIGVLRSPRLSKPSGSNSMPESRPVQTPMTVEKLGVEA